MVTALELGPEGWKSYALALRDRPEPVITPEQAAERDRLIEVARHAARMLKEQYGASRVVLFGSLAHGKWFDAHSDVDLAVDGILGPSFNRAWVDLDALFGPRTVDLVDVADASATVRRSILTEGVDL